MLSFYPPGRVPCLSKFQCLNVFLRFRFWQYWQQIPYGFFSLSKLWSNSPSCKVVKLYLTVLVIVVSLQLYVHHNAYTTNSSQSCQCKLYLLNYLLLFFHSKALIYFTEKHAQLMKTLQLTTMLKLDYMIKRCDGAKINKICWTNAGVHDGALVSPHFHSNAMVILLSSSCFGKNQMSWWRL